MENRERIIVLGGDGFCGWPTSLRLSIEGYDVVIVDNLSRRKIDVELGCESLTPIKPLEQRLRRWEEISGRRIDYCALNIADDYEALEQLIREVRPKAIVHFAEQRAAPYSMKSPRHKRYTVDNNINGTHNILCAIVESGLDIHLVHLGTMGVYGYGTAGMSIPEGYLTVKVDEDVDPNARPSEVNDELLSAATESAPDPVELAPTEDEDDDDDDDDHRRGRRRNNDDDDDDSDEGEED